MATSTTFSNVDSGEPRGGCLRAAIAAPGGCAGLVAAARAAGDELLRHQERDARVRV